MVDGASLKPPSSNWRRAIRQWRLQDDETEARLDQIENEIRFRMWVRKERIFETMTADELEAYAITGIWVERPEPAFGMSRFDSMDRASLIKLWREELKAFRGRTSDELEFYAIHGHWPEQDSAVAVEQ